MSQLRFAWLWMSKVVEFGECFGFLSLEGTPVGSKPTIAGSLSEVLVTSFLAL